MPRVGMSEQAGRDLEKIFDHLASFDAKSAATTVREIEHALETLGQNPMIGRPAPPDRRELLIGKRKHGYTATYRYEAGDELVLITSIRSQHQSP